MRITNLNDVIYASHERQKALEYEERIVHIEKGNFISFAMSATGGLGPSANGFVQRLAYRIAAKRREPYSKIVCMPTTKRVSILPGESRTVRSRGYALGHPCDIVLYESRTHLLNE